MAVQNQSGNNPTRWDKCGVIVEMLPFDQYRVMLDGSRRTTLRNRKYLRPYVALREDIPVRRSQPTVFQEEKTSPPARDLLNFSRVPEQSQERTPENSGEKDKASQSDQPPHARRRISLADQSGEAMEPTRIPEWTPPTPEQQEPPSPDHMSSTALNLNQSLQEDSKRSLIREEIKPFLKPGLKEDPAMFKGELTRTRSGKVKIPEEGSCRNNST